MDYGQIYLTRATDVVVWGWNSTINKTVLAHCAELREWGAVSFVHIFYGYNLQFHSLSPVGALSQAVTLGVISVTKTICVTKNNYVTYRCEGEKNLTWKQLGITAVKPEQFLIFQPVFLIRSLHQLFCLNGHNNKCLHFLYCYILQMSPSWSGLFWYTDTRQNMDRSLLDEKIW